MHVNILLPVEHFVFKLAFNLLPRICTLSLLHYSRDILFLFDEYFTEVTAALDGFPERTFSTIEAGFFTGQMLFLLPK